MTAPGWLTARPIAHRGYHDARAGRIENTLPAAEAAIAKNFAIECDLQLTADSRAIVFHDGTLDRLTETKGPVRARTLAEVRAPTLSGSDARIPTLEDLLDLVGGRVPVIIELKSPWDGDRQLEQAVATILASYSGPAAVMSFDPASMVAIRHLAPAVPRGMVADRFDAGPERDRLSPARRFALHHLLAVGTVRPHFVSYGIEALPAAAPLILRRFGVPLISWTIRTPAEREKARLYCDQITFEGFDPDMA